MISSLGRLTRGDNMHVWTRPFIDLRGMFLISLLAMLESAGMFHMSRKRYPPAFDLPAPVLLE